MMSKNLKIILGIIAVLLALCCLLGGAFALLVPRMAESFVENALTENPAQAAEVAQGIIDYTPPAGYAAQMAMNFAGIKMVMITPQTTSGGMIIMLMEYPAAFAGDPEQMQQQMETSMAQQSGYRGMDMNASDSQEVVINGETVVLAVMEGADDSGNQLRQVAGVFESKSGAPAMLMIMGELTSWDAAAYDSFIQSMGTGR
ncbi:MAG: hypothetical protein R6X34_06640 [Chloroflexota bacterium]